MTIHIKEVARDEDNNCCFIEASDDGDNTVIARTKNGKEFYKLQYSSKNDEAINSCLLMKCELAKLMNRGDSSGTYPVHFIGLLVATDLLTRVVYDYLNLLPVFEGRLTPAQSFALATVKDRYGRDKDIYLWLVNHMNVKDSTIDQIKKLKESYLPGEGTCTKIDIEMIKSISGATFKVTKGFSLTRGK